MLKLFFQINYRSMKICQNHCKKTYSFPFSFKETLEIASHLFFWIDSDLFWNVSHLLRWSLVKVDKTVLPLSLFIFLYHTIFLRFHAKTNKINICDVVIQKLCPPKMTCHFYPCPIGHGQVQEVHLSTAI